MRGRFADNLEQMQWMKAFYEKNYSGLVRCAAIPYHVVYQRRIWAGCTPTTLTTHTSPPDAQAYDAVARRAKGRGADAVPAFATTSASAAGGAGGDAPLPGNSAAAEEGSAGVAQPSRVTTAPLASVGVPAQARTSRGATSPLKPQPAAARPPAVSTTTAAATAAVAKGVVGAATKAGTTASTTATATAALAAEQRRAIDDVRCSDGIATAYPRHRSGAYSPCTVHATASTILRVLAADRGQCRALGVSRGAGAGARFLLREAAGCRGPAAGLHGGRSRAR